MTVTSRVPALIDYLVTLFTNDPTIGAATPPVTVYDGPPVTALNTPLTLYIGLTDPDSDAMEPMAESQQTWAALGRRGRDEIVTIHCVAEAWSGSDTVQAQRIAAAGIVAAVETLMQADGESPIVWPPDKWQPVTQQVKAEKVAKSDASSA